MEKMFPCSNKAQRYIFRATITINGIVYKAKDFGHRAFRIPVND